MTLTPVFQTPCGSIQGLYDAENNINIFKGIRFANAERFEYPVKVTSWEGTYQATEFGPAAFQESAFVEPDPNEFYHKEFYEGEQISYSEDCLFLNIWAPKGAKNAPVLVYIHGGAFDHGYSYEKPFDGTALCKRGVILVTISYRLGALGFLALPEIQETYGHSGNYALLDQMTALSWLQDNIRAFGGDPYNVTLSGQSAGAMSVQLHCVSPLTDGLFHRAIMYSGGGVTNPSRHTRTLENPLTYGKQFMKRLGASTLDELKQMDVKAITMEFFKMRNELGWEAKFGKPVIDGYFLPESEYDLTEKGLQKDIPYLIGTTSEDICLDTFPFMAEDWVKRQHNLGRKPSYLYRFSRQLPGDNNGAWHSSDLWYVFGTLDRCWRPFEETDYKLSDSIVNYLANFARTGDPNGGNEKEWPAYDEKKCYRMEWNL